MPTYAILEIDRHYLIKESEDDEIILVQPLMETTECILLVEYSDAETTYWRKKEDEFDELIEELTDEQVEEYENLFEEDDAEDEGEEWP